MSDYNNTYGMNGDHSSRFLRSSASGLVGGVGPRSGELGGVGGNGVMRRGGFLVLIPTGFFRRLHLRPRLLFGLRFPEPDWSPGGPPAASIVRNVHAGKI